MSIPETLHGSKRVYIQFSAKSACATLPAFGAFIFERLKPVVDRWDNLKQVQEWCGDRNTRTAWKNKVQNAWFARIRSAKERKPREVIDLTQLPNAALTYNGRDFGDCVLYPIPQYWDTPPELCADKHSAIRVRIQRSKGRKRAFVYVRVPNLVTGSSKSKKDVNGRNLR